MEIIQYALPKHWIRYDSSLIINELVNAKAAVLSLVSMPYQRAWAERLQEMELKREVAGTSKIEGADFTDHEFEDAVSERPKNDHLTRSQRQARAAIITYKWIERLDAKRKLDVGLIKEIHRKIVTDCDEDHCPPGQFRGDLQNVTFGRPRHRGVEGGGECEKAISKLLKAFEEEYRQHDPLIQALAIHYHIGAMHPFYDGNGRTARALESLLLRRSQLKDTLFIAMSNYYYDEKDAYLRALSAVREQDYDLTSFLKFALTGIALQCHRLLNEIRIHVQKSLFRDVLGTLYGRLQSSRKRALAARQHEILNVLLERETPIEYRSLSRMMEKHYRGLKALDTAFIRDLNQIMLLRAITVSQSDRRSPIYLAVRLEWATEITETEFYERIDKLPQAKTRLIFSP